MATSEAYDFIVVGAGPAGCALASRLAQSQSRPKVLLLEAGGDNADLSLRMEGNKWIQFMTPILNWSYKSTPQEHLAGREVSLDRGKGLGGSSSINFLVWTVGARDDWETVAKLTGDGSWGWERAQARWKSLETHHSLALDSPVGTEQYVKPLPDNHGSKGPLHVGFPPEWESHIPPVLDAFAANGYPRTLDINDGEGLGMGMLPSTAWRGVRTTAADLLFDCPENLQIVTDAPVHRVLFEGKRAVEVALIDGRTFKAAKEIILSAGSLDTPRILMHSGIGPADQLAEYNIDILHENARVGQNYQDHYHLFLKFIRKEGTMDLPGFFRDKARQRRALRDWQLFRSGEYTTVACSGAIGFFKSEAITSSREFADLPAAERERLNLPTVPHWEVAVGGPAAETVMAPDTAPDLLPMAIFVHNSQGRGEARLCSADPAVPLEFHPDFLRHPYDRRVAVEATREALRVARSEPFRKDLVGEFEVPASDSEEDILDFWARNLMSTWHMLGTCKMGRSEKEDLACVDPDLKVFGVDGLRVADNSIMPVLPSCHTQSTAYQIGMVAAEKLIAEYGL